MIIKFRAWDIICDKYVTRHFRVSKDGELLILFNNSLEGYITVIQSDYIIEQFTGIKDRNGKDVYVGDILTIWCGSSKQSGYLVVNDMLEFFEDYFETGYRGITKIELVGNIHDDKHLLKDKIQTKE